MAHKVPANRHQSTPTVLVRYRPFTGLVNITRFGLTKGPHQIFSDRIVPRGSHLRFALGIVCCSREITLSNIDVGPQMSEQIILITVHLSVGFCLLLFI
jgi:hypothetical protein